MSTKIIRAIIAIIAGYALYNGLHLSLKEWDTTGACPSVSGVPACYVVSFAYFLILFSALTDKPPLYNRLFYTGFSIVFGLAAIGSLMQVSGMMQCPKTSNDLPMCYISLMVSLCLIVLFFVRKKTTQ